ncbi:hypothetical protein [Microbacterium sp. SORGH_AS_0888]|uniref:hypothetical protein n=1 Tax=Microbacterium sp. SORGH_AS_0888 TaxID=3041791 RepID=UPI00278785AF|nr:hypothetical protein [Microbacterium sp. SORGH_AS_0888]MDQ1130986.1 hypothetical protein [Microbacterium sp. SORGH_AS_0888]
MPHRTVVATSLVATLLLVCLTGCAGSDWSIPHPATTAVGTPSAGFAPAIAPTPEATVMPADGSWRGVRPSPGYRVALLVGDDSSTTTALVAAVTAWASETNADLRTVSGAEDPVAGIVAAMELHPELVVSVGDPLIDPLATVSANHLDVPFLVLGAELAEPTANVTAVDWTGAGYRGEGLGTATHFSEASFTAERCGDAIRAGVAAVLTGMTGVVLWLP